MTKQVTAARRTDEREFAQRNAGATPPRSASGTPASLPESANITESAAMSDRRYPPRTAPNRSAWPPHADDRSHAAFTAIEGRAAPGRSGRRSSRPPAFLDGPLSRVDVDQGTGVGPGASGCGRRRLRKTLALDTAGRPVSRSSSGPPDAAASTSITVPRASPKIPLQRQGPAVRQRLLARPARTHGSTPAPCRERGTRPSMCARADEHAYGHVSAAAGGEQSRDGGTVEGVGGQAILRCRWA